MNVHLHFMQVSETWRFCAVLFEVGFPVEAEGNGGWCQAMCAHIGVRGSVRPLRAANYSKPQLLLSIQLVSYNRGRTSMPLKRSIMFFSFFSFMLPKLKEIFFNRADGVFVWFFFSSNFILFIAREYWLSGWHGLCPHSPHAHSSTCPESCHPQQKLSKAPLDKVLPSMPAHHVHHRYYWPIIHTLIETRKEKGGRVLDFFSFRVFSRQFWGGSGLFLSATADILHSLW